MDDPLSSLVARALPVLRAAPLRLAVLFGSAARGRLRPDSDLDIGFLPTRDLPLADELALQASLERATGRTVDLVDLDRADVLLRFEIARYGRVLVSEPASEATRFVAVAGIEHAELAPLIADAAERYRRRLATVSGAAS